MNIQNLKNLFFRTVIAITVCYTNVTFAAQPSINTILANFSMTVPDLMRLVTAIAYVTGMFFVVKGIGNLRALGKEKQGGGIIYLKPQIILIFVGTALMYLPSSALTVTNTLFLDANTAPFAYIYPDKIDEWSGVINICLMIMKLVGTIFYIKGLITFSHNQAAQDGQPSSFSRGITHMIGGVPLR